MIVNKEKENGLDHAELVRRMTLIDGKLYYIVDEGRRVVSGNRVGTQYDDRTYRRVIINGKIFQEHRIIWFYVNGKWPDGMLDHIDRDKSNNRIENLRESNCVLNQRNTSLNKNNQTGHNGVSTRYGKYQAHIKSNNKKKHLGTYDTIEEAITARKDAERRYWK